MAISLYRHFLSSFGRRGDITLSYFHGKTTFLQYALMFTHSNYLLCIFTQALVPNTFWSLGKLEVFVKVPYDFQKVPWEKYI
jgi:hypothetical protein